MTSSPSLKRSAAENCHPGNNANKRCKVADSSNEKLVELLREENLELKTRLKNHEARFTLIEKSIEESTKPDKQDDSDLDREPSDRDVLSLNVGGTRIQVLRGTLTLVEGSMLASKFSGRWDDGSEKDQEGNFFIDQPIELFKPMIDFLRDKSCEVPSSRPVTPPAFGGDREMMDRFERLVEFYGMTSFIYPMELKLFNGHKSNSMVTSYPDYSVAGTERAYFKVVPLGHGRKVRSFEVFIGKIEYGGGAIGWMVPSKINVFLVFRKEGPCGVMTSPNNNTDVIFCGSVREGSVVRCENRGREWLVDGKVVARSPDLGENFVQSCVPFVSVHGSLRISCIELE